MLQVVTVAYLEINKFHVCNNNTKWHIFIAVHY